ncbi:hypothetical protein CORC01_03738 [Colletotrichum orchidophilum]|uniref:Uncharacterized protein n=1 Tax=Colletotrichum orchidophilum TaxID=1209926 RepID=A0A1G4BHB4_9PEZI|nr:uncharacterized protein CORC01_03738 [Colletotrichum orchidophilum]OHF00910.1 hypothetical protein CORC01_03738 [Colletotrichum orchidophilum]
MGPKKIFSKSEANDPMTEKKLMSTYDIKIAVAAYRIQRRVLETLHRTLLAELREAHTVELEDFKENLHVQTLNSRSTCCATARQTSKSGSTKEPTPFNDRNMPARKCICQRMEITRFQMLQAKERKKAGKVRKEELHGLRREHGDLVIPEKNGGITEGDCVEEISAILVDWGLANVEYNGETRQWEDDLEDMVEFHVQHEQDERKRLRGGVVGLLTRTGKLIGKHSAETVLLGIETDSSTDDDTCESTT